MIVSRTISVLSAVNILDKVRAQGCKVFIDYVTQTDGLVMRERNVVTSTWYENRGKELPKFANNLRKWDEAC